MVSPIDQQALHALKTAYCYMPNANDVNEYDHPGRVAQIIADIEAVKEVLMIYGVDPDEVGDEIHPDQANNSSY